ncbi:MAG: M48 family metalloprotease [Burkholderiales bacterium]|nr:M48 family metalloprotease [Burkholderiales bacterium]
MRTFSKATVALVLAMCSSAAFAQFGGFLSNLPSLGGGSSSGVNVGNLVDNVGKMAKEVGEPEEIALGQETAATLLGARPLLNNQGVQRYVNTLGRWLASQTERPDLPWTFAVIDDPSYNAFAAPGGYIFVTAGLMANMRTEAELAGVLAHEIAHVVRKHHLNSVKSNAGMSLMTDLVASKTGGNEAVKGFVKNMAKNMFSKGLSKEDEFEADRDGIVIAARAGFDPYGLPTVLQMLAAHSGSEEGFSLLMSTHPSPTARLEKLDSLIQNQFDKAPTSGGKPLKDRFREFK